MQSGVDERLARFQDWDLAIRFAAVAGFRLVDEPLVHIHSTPGSISANNAAGASALHLMLETHAALYERHPGAKAAVLTGLGHLECLAGDMGHGRRDLLRSLRIRPMSTGTWAALLLSVLGSRVYRFGSVVKNLAGSSFPLRSAMIVAARES